MSRPLLQLACLSFLTLDLPAAAAPPPQPAEVATRWHQLLGEQKTTEAGTFCAPLVDAESPEVRVEAHKCLANVTLSQASVVSVSTAAISDGFDASKIRSAIEHLEAALALAPKDLSLHQGRLYALQRSAQYREMNLALENSIQVYKEPDAIEAWLDYAPEFMDLGANEAGLEFTRVLERHYPNESRVLGNMGAFLTLLERDDEAETYLRKAVKMGGEDPLDLWNLARLLEYRGRSKEADPLYRRSLAKDSTPENACLYAHFVADKLKEPGRACKLEKESCPAEEQTACPK